MNLDPRCLWRRIFPQVLVAWPNPHKVENDNVFIHLVQEHGLICSSAATEEHIRKVHFRSHQEVEVLEACLRAFPEVYGMATHDTNVCRMPFHAPTPPARSSDPGDPEMWPQSVEGLAAEEREREARAARSEVRCDYHDVVCVSTAKPCPIHGDGKPRSGGRHG